MKNNRNKRVLILTVVLTLLFTVVAYAYTEGCGGNIHANGNNVIFNASVSTSLNASDLNEISLYHEGIGLGKVLFKITKIDRNQYYNALTDDELKDNASSGIYESTVVGKIDYVHPNYNDYNGFDQSEFYHNMAYTYYKNLTNHLLDKTNAEISDSFNLDLNTYEKISRYDSKFEEDKLFLLCPKVDAQPGDSVSTVYLDETNNSGIVLKQDKNGLNYKYSFVRDDIDYWIIADKQTTY